MRLAFLDSGYGLLPTVRYILKNNVKHECFFFMCNEFPLGELSNRKLNKIKRKYLNQFNNLSIDKIYVCCNTLSLVFNDVPNSFCILEFNKKFMDEYTTFIATPRTINNLNYNNSIALKDMAKAIEDNNINNIINTIRNLKIKTPKAILGCTHYPLVKKIFKYYHQNTLFKDGLNNMLEMIDKGEGQVLYANEKAYEVIKRFYPFLVLNKIYTS